MAHRRDRMPPVDVWLEPASWEDRRGLRRLDASLTAALDRPDRPASDVRVLDLSVSGCRVQASSLREGDRVWLHLDAAEPVCAHVAWAGAAEAGLEFRQPLHPVAVARLTGSTP